MTKKQSACCGRRGFTLIELIITISLMIILTIVGLLNLTGRKGTTNLTDGAKQMVATLRQAQSHSMANDKGVAWGVRFSNLSTSTFFALFSSSYSTANTVGYYRLPDGVAYVTSSLPVGSTTDIIFNQVSGGLNASRTIMINLPSQPSQSSTISISTIGAVSY